MVVMNVGIATIIISFEHPCTDMIFTYSCPLVRYHNRKTLLKPVLGCGCVLTLSSALSSTWLSGEAPSRGNHWSRTSSGSDSRSLTGSTRDPMGWSQALDS